MKEEMTVGRYPSILLKKLPISYFKLFQISFVLFAYNSFDQYKKNPPRTYISISSYKTAEKLHLLR